MSVSWIPIPIMSWHKKPKLFWAPRRFSSCFPSRIPISSSPSFQKYYSDYVLKKIDLNVFCHFCSQKTLSLEELLERRRLFCRMKRGIQTDKVVQCNHHHHQEHDTVKSTKGHSHHDKYASKTLLLKQSKIIHSPSSLPLIQTRSKLTAKTSKLKAIESNAIESMKVQQYVDCHINITSVSVAPAAEPSAEFIPAEIPVSPVKYTQPIFQPTLTCITEEEEEEFIDEPLVRCVSAEWILNQDSTVLSDEQPPLDLVDSEDPLDSQQPDVKDAPLIEQEPIVIESVDNIQMAIDTVTPLKPIISHVKSTWRGIPFVLLYAMYYKQKWMPKRFTLAHCFNPLFKNLYQHSISSVMAIKQCIRTMVKQGTFKRPTMQYGLWLIYFMVSSRQFIQVLPQLALQRKNSPPLAL